MSGVGQKSEPSIILTSSMNQLSANSPENLKVTAVAVVGIENVFVVGVVVAAP